MRNSLAILLALGAAGLYGLGNALEHRVVTETDAGTDLDIGLLRKLARRPLWLFGMFGDVGAYGLQAAALAYGALLLVQPLLACGLLVALPLNARWTHRRITRREWIAAALLCASLATFLVEASPGGGAARAPLASWLRIGGTVGILIAIAVVVASRAHGHVRAALLGFAAGGLFGLTAALTKTFVDQIQHGVPYTASHWEVYALAVLSIVGILFTQHGFHASSLSASLPALEATEPLVASIVGVTLLHEHLNGRTPFDNVLITASILTTLACVVLLASIAGRGAVAVQPEATGRAPFAPQTDVARRSARPARDPRYLPRSAATNVRARHRSRRVPRLRRLGSEGSEPPTKETT